jgi:hypothetical protein
LHWHHQHNNNNIQWWVCFWGEYFFLHFFYHCFYLHLNYFFQLNTCGHNMGSAKAQSTDWSLASRPHCHYANNNMQWWVCFLAELFFLHFFYHFFSCVSIIFFQLNTYGPCTKTAKTQPTGWSLASHPHCHYTNNNTQWQV